MKTTTPPNKKHALAKTRRALAEKNIRTQIPHAPPPEMQDWVHKLDRLLLCLLIAASACLTVGEVFIEKCFDFREHVNQRFQHDGPMAESGIEKQPNRKQKEDKTQNRLEEQRARIRRGKNRRARESTNDNNGMCLAGRKRRPEWMNWGVRVEMKKTDSSCRGISGSAMGGA